MSAHAIGTLLEEQGIVRSAVLFALLARIQDLGRHLEAGDYLLAGNQPTTSVIRSLLKAPIRTRRVTIPEGLTRYEIAGLLARQGAADSARFAALTQDPDLARRLGLASPDVEGFLFPETYFLDPDSPEETIIRRMVGQFHAFFVDSLRARARDLGLSVRQVVILASIVEREAAVSDERPLIAGVFLRRLRLHRRLESCSTVEYALGTHKARLTNADLKIDSPYNTYRHRGLPPGPIANPGKAALLATLYPRITDYLYFVARGDGTHIFSRTHREHERAKRRLRHRRRR